jgi:glycosyltransferase involved in cell wall biosynthesis
MGIPLPADLGDGGLVDPALRILQVNSLDIDGGAAKITRDLFQAYRRRGHESWLIVGYKRTSDPYVWELDHDPYRKGLPGLLGKAWKPVRKFEPEWPGLRSLRRRLLLAVDCRRTKNWLKGLEDFEFPATAHLLDLTPAKPDIVHLNNLHGNFFDLRELAMLSQQVPVVLLLHDAWLLSGHCAHSFDCERWKTGCGDCPDLTIPPSIRKDATAINWQQKREIYSKSRLYIVTPSRWLIQKVEASIMMPGIVGTRIIPNGVDLSKFKPGDKELARTSIGVEQDTKVILCAAVDIKSNIFKDFHTMRSAIAIIAEHHREENMVLLALGEDAPPERIGRAEIRLVPYQNEPQIVARYFQAADVYIHSVHADTFPITILEALACGKPVVATAVGGIPEQISDGETGFLVPPGDAPAMAARIEQILRDDELRWKMGQAAADSARRRFDLERQVDDYLKLYESVLANWKPGAERGL